MPDGSFGTNTQIAVLEERINSLRRQVITVTVMGVMVLGALIGLEANERVASGDTIEARNFVVRDTRGDARAVLQCLDNDGVQLVFFREALTGAAWRSHARPGPFAFGARDWHGNGQMVLAGVDGGKVGVFPTNISIGGRGDKTSILMAAEPNGEGSLMLADSTGTQARFTPASLTRATQTPTAGEVRHPRFRRSR